jgi:lipopolysaccharide export LptBFGC system permease protein LptF
MPINAKEIRAKRTPVQRNIASLVGGIVIGLGCFVLWLLVTSEITQAMPSPILITLGAAIALAIGFWIRLADM